ncbi:Nif3-like dinuclear metal center hexameric protein [Accumulibacter sp.]|uniref:Nif3-like dinuclear metal center hexameric protein n=1 Tax=Accumulibacter sp. TaxID=2053492 RepID=UPI002CC60FF0|nr:Nif3-like dinuclear metal center hexameric protein [Accumulibacter sp.]HNE38500.1 Nif3-like dinuclear metal center hexameric protein [Accumulibacter sp.]HNG88355.1 Nif3-like dinuclear metal center hexameric protein [Accumulibacter sp.]HNI50233.1 Nif3-like dinuclear metal center hexameric protein [Accumulibacter sp.]
MKRDELTRYLDGLLDAGRWRDYCPNGLQVEGRPEIERVVAGVSASAALIEAAIERNADAILVHHGWFWRGEDARIVGIRRKRLHLLLAHEINLIAYHLPLDSHAELGNNAQLAGQLDWRVDGRFGEQDIGWSGHLAVPTTLGELAKHVSSRLQRTPLVIGEASCTISRIAWCSGAAQNLFEQAIALGVDAYLSGEISEQTVHLARESGTAFIAAGHHASERYGVRALAEHLAEHCGLHCEFVDLDNPV